MTTLLTTTTELVRSTQKFSLLASHLGVSATGYLCYHSPLMMKIDDNLHPLLFFTNSLSYLRGAW